MTAPAAISQLVKRFECRGKTNDSADCDEAQLRQEFLNPFFEALGWDVYNTKGYSDAYKEVIHEAAIKVGGRTKAPDYCFRAGGGKASFFVEAKKPAVDVGEAVGPAFQLRRYAWSAKLPVSLLTDFEELAVYDCRIRPVKTDKASTARVMLLHYTEYAARWDELAGLFSPEAIRRGAMDKFLASKKVRKGTAEVDAAFLAEIETWRDLLARNIALRNPGISQRDLDVSVQRTIDRLVFLRICEDRGIEPYGALQGLGNGPGVYPRLGELFQRADQRYNSGLFHFNVEQDRKEPPDEVSLGLAIDDKPLQEIIEKLYYPESPYEFSVLPTEILGQVYEQFLGKVIRLTKGGQAKVEEKPEVRKAGGVYYTPTYIVDYIVEQTVGKLLEGKSLAQASKLRILDPACGSGSFLLGAYQRLLDWHRDRYLGEDPEKHARGWHPTLYRGAAGQWRLTTAERKRILLNNIYGVDIDPQAVEVTKLSLLLKVLEGESKETVNNQLRFFHERAMPDLGSNIKCGNSLIGPDFYEGRQQDLFDEEAVYRINAFDWRQEFAEIFRGANPGFSAVIGNPPYLFITEVPPEMRQYFQRTYRGVCYRFDLYVAFVEKAMTALLAQSGLLGFIIPHTLLSNDSFQPLRAVLAGNAIATRIVDVGPGVFQDATNETMLVFLENSPPTRSSEVEVIRTTARQFPKPIERFLARQSQWAPLSGAPWLVHVSAEKLRVVECLERAAFRLGSLCTANQGLRTGDNQRHLSERRHGLTWKPAAGGKHVSRYGLIPGGLFVRYEPAVLDAPRKEEIFTTEEKIVVQEVRNIALPHRIVASLDRRQTFCLQSTNVINIRPDSSVGLCYVLGVLNSTPANFYFRCRFPGNNHVPTNQLLQIPIPYPADRAQHERMTRLVEGMLGLQKRLGQVHAEHEKSVLSRQITATDRLIDQLVYELYGLTEAEITIVEEAIAPSRASTEA